ncbi:MAG: hypothetical protein FWC16_05820 [Defluviitaleaceae bacterium]|nr:hypothetical protein [Defluviitaleaceae bacterium]MCL2274425.1 hypothetical protein [Defluviitaleaceae bacterium]
MMRVYLDNCCYSRPYDGQKQIKIQLETEAKLFIQSLVKLKAIKLVASFVLMEEVNASSEIVKVQAVMSFINEHSSVFVGSDCINELTPMAANAIMTGVKAKDAIHLACAIFAECDYFISTDKRLLNYTSDKIKLLNPIEFMELWEEINHE